MKRLIIIALMLLAGVEAAPAATQSREKPAATATKVRKRERGVSHYGFQIEPNGDTTTVVYAVRIYCFDRPMDMSKHRKLVRDFLKVYPLARVAHYKMAGFEEQLVALPTRKQQRQFARATEKSLVGEYTPVLKRMTISQGKILVRLIDRETTMTSYDIVKEFRGGFVAGFWQGIARLFGHNLKDEYDAAERDRLIEQCLLLHEAGLLPQEYYR